MDTPFNTGHTNLDGAYVAGYDPATGTANVDITCRAAVTLPLVPMSQALLGREKQIVVHPCMALLMM